MIDFTIWSDKASLFHVRLYRRYYKPLRFLEWGRLPTPGWYIMVGPFIFNINDVRR